MTITVHGIVNCDTVKRARGWLEAHEVAYAFHDYKKVGIPAETVSGWAGQVGWDVLLNRAGTTFRKLPDDQKAAIDEAQAIALMVAQPSMIKRPVVTGAGRTLVGFKPDEWASVILL